MSEQGKSESERPQFSEIMEGKDVSEGIVVPVYYFEPGERRTKVLVDRKVGEEDYSVRQKLVREGTLLGAIVPAEQGEYVYIGIREPGFIIKVEDSRFADWYSLDRNSSYDINDPRFRQSISGRTFGEVTMTEDDNPEEFNRRVVAAVESARAKEKKNKAQRVESRNKLKQGLFGNKTNA
jgi:hypothetical protein